MREIRTSGLMSGVWKRDSLLPRQISTLPQGEPFMPDLRLNSLERSATGQSQPEHESVTRWIAVGFGRLREKSVLDGYRRPSPL